MPPTRHGSSIPVAWVPAARRLGALLSVVLLLATTPAGGQQAAPASLEDWRAQARALKLQCQKYSLSGAQCRRLIDVSIGKPPAIVTPGPRDTGAAGRASAQRKVRDARLRSIRAQCQAQGLSAEACQEKLKGVR